MRHALIILLSFCFALPSAFAQSEQLDVAILNLEADKENKELADTLTSIVRNEAMQVETYKVVNKYPIQLSDIALLVGCSPESATCLKQVAGEVEARVLIYGTVRRQAETSYQIDVNVFDVSNGRMLNRLTRTLTDTDPVAGFRKEIEAFFAEQRVVAQTRLQIGASVDGAQIRINDAFVGVVPLERKGLDPGKYTIQVAHPDYQVWETVVELGAGADERVWAQLVPVSGAAEGADGGATDDVVHEVVREPNPPEPVRGGVNWGAWSALTVGGLALGGSVAFGVLLENTERKLEREAADGMLTERRYQDLFDKGKDYELAHRILLGVGAVGLTTGVVWLVVDGFRERRAAVGVSPDGVMVSVRW